MPELFTPSEAAAEVLVSQETLRYWERAGLLSAVGRDSASRRQYSRADLAFIQVIRCLRITGMPVRMIRRFTELVRGGPDTATLRLRLLRQHRAEVVDRLRAQERALQVIDEKIAAYQEMTR